MRWTSCYRRGTSTGGTWAIYWRLGMTPRTWPSKRLQTPAITRSMRAFRYLLAQLRWQMRSILRIWTTHIFLWQPGLKTKGSETQTKRRSTPPRTRCMSTTPKSTTSRRATTSLSSSAFFLNRCLHKNSSYTSSPWRNCRLWDFTGIRSSWSWSTNSISMRPRFSRKRRWRTSESSSPTSSTILRVKRAWSCRS